MFPIFATDSILLTELAEMVGRVLPTFFNLTSWPIWKMVTQYLYGAEGLVRSYFWLIAKSPGILAFQGCVWLFAWLKELMTLKPVTYSWYAVLVYQLENCGLEQNAYQFKTMGLIPKYFAYFALSVINFKNVPNGETLKFS